MNGNEILTHAVPIWFAGSTSMPDEYAEFDADFSAENTGKFEFYIAAGSEYSLYLDGRLIDFGQYQDYPGRLIYDTLTFDAEAGEHTLRVIAWHWGVDSFTHTKRPPYVIFGLRGTAGEQALVSSENTPSRRAPGYVPYKNHTITSQLGLGCEYSAADAADKENSAFTPSVRASVGTQDGSYVLLPRPIKRCDLLPDTAMTVVRRGYYRAASGAAFSDDPGLALDSAELDVERKDADGCYLVADTGAEETGFIKFLFSASRVCDVLVGWGEHLTPERETPRTAMGSRRFYYRYTAARGQNRRTEPMRRAGCRYLEIFVADPDADIRYLGLVPERYPVTLSAAPVKDAARRAVYDCAVRTLELCMHEHYEDCPWREQSLYSLDSRTQMLCGYAAFADGNAKFVRASLDLISRSERPDGLLTLCAPAGIDRPIPCYSLSYIMQMKEYGDFSGDAAFLESKLDLLERIASVFLDRRASEHGGAVRRLPDRLGYWNFYEWAKTLDGRSIHKETADADLPAEAPLTAFLAMACRDLGAIFELCAAKNGEKADVFAKKAEYYRAAGSELAAAIRNVFFDADAGLFRSFTDRADAPFAVLTQALCLLAGAGEGTDTSRALEAVAVNGGEGLVPATLSSSVFRFDALAAADAEKYAPVILAELDRDGKYMLDRGATTFWETIKGAADFGGAGSLCHGWSALAALWYTRLEAHVGC